jgi:hypothetical protein
MEEKFTVPGLAITVSQQSHQQVITPSNHRKVRITIYYKNKVRLINISTI